MKGALHETVNKTEEMDFNLRKSLNCMKPNENRI